MFLLITRIGFKCSCSRCGRLPLYKILKNQSNRSTLAGTPSNHRIKYRIASSFSVTTWWPASSSDALPASTDRRFVVARAVISALANY